MGSHFGEKNNTNLWGKEVVTSNMLVSPLSSPLSSTKQNNHVYPSTTPKSPCLALRAAMTAAAQDKDPPPTEDEQSTDQPELTIEHPPKTVNQIQTPNPRSPNQMSQPTPLGLPPPPPTKTPLQHPTKQRRTPRRRVRTRRG